MSTAPAAASQALEQQAAALLHQGREREAELLVRHALASGTASARLLLSYAALLRRQGRDRALLPVLRRAFQLRPRSPAFLVELARLLQETGQRAEALACWREAVAQDPHNGQTLADYGLALVVDQQAAAGLPWLEQALRLRPADGRIRFNHAFALQEAGCLEQAGLAYQQLLQRDPRCWAAWQNLTVVWRRLGRLAAAQSACERLLAHDPTQLPVLRELALIFHDLGDEARAAQALHGAIAQDPTELAYRFAAIPLQSIPQSCHQIAVERARFHRQVLALAADPTLELRAGLPFNPAFWLSYHNAVDRPLLEAVHALVAPRRQPAPAASPLPPAPACQRQRVGLLSGLYSQAGHVIQLLYGPLLAALEQAPDLEPVLLDPATLTTPPSAPICDLLFYLDVDMVPAIWSLAHARLAPVQVTSWGTPNTSGMASIDYYLSAAAIEPPGAEAFYTETLIRLSRLPCTYSPPALAGIRPDRAGLQLPLQGPLIGLPQSLFKLHPSYDAVLERIVRAVPDCRLVLLEGSRPRHTALLRQRWGSQAPLLLERTLFLPRLSRERYLTLLDTVDVLLDPFYFGSGNSFYEAMAVGTPLVTLPGRFMRGRIVAGGYQQMGLEQQAPIARSAEHYVEWVVQLAADAQLRAQLKATIRTAAQQHLFNDQAIAAEFLEVFRAAIAASRAGSRLPPGWRPAPSRR